MKVKFNWMDGLIVLALLAVVAVGGLFLSSRGGGQGAEEHKTVQMMVEFTSKDEAFSQLPKEGDAVVIGEKEKVPATVVGVEVIPAVTLGYDTVNGAVYESQVPGKYDVRLILEGDGVETNQTVSMNGTAMRVGSGEVIRSKNWAGYGFVLSIDTF